jgi:hypothetical protein
MTTPTVREAVARVALERKHRPSEISDPHGMMVQYADIEALFNHARMARRVLHNLRFGTCPDGAAKAYAFLSAALCLGLTEPDLEAEMLLLAVERAERAEREASG